LKLILSGKLQERFQEAHEGNERGKFNRQQSRQESLLSHREANSEHQQVGAEASRSNGESSQWWQNPILGISIVEHPDWSIAAQCFA
jgi:hypothetical protein